MIPLSSQTELQVSDSQKAACDKAVGYDNLMLTQAAQYLWRFTDITEKDPVLSPQQVADGFYLRYPDHGRELYYNVSNVLRLLAWAKSGDLDKEYWLKREWLSVDDGYLIATEVPWTLTSNTGLQIFPDKESAIEKSHMMLSAWKENNKYLSTTSDMRILSAWEDALANGGDTSELPLTSIIAIPESPVSFEGAY